MSSWTPDCGKTEALVLSSAVFWRAAAGAAAAAAALFPAADTRVLPRADAGDAAGCPLLRVRVAGVVILVDAQASWSPANKRKKTLNCELSAVQLRTQCTVTPRDSTLFTDRTGNQCNAMRVLADTEVTVSATSRDGKEDEGMY